MHIIEAESSDLPAILELQYLAFQSEAELLGKRDIPPLKQTLNELEAESRQGTILKAENDAGEIIGSVRGRVEERTLFIGKLMVHPRWRRQGLGARLLRAMEDHCPAGRYELFTSSLSLGNLNLYQRLGYTRFKESDPGANPRLIYLEKTPAAGEGGITLKPGP
jgi:Predicted acetyltransferase